MQLQIPEEMDIKQLFDSSGQLNFTSLLALIDSYTAEDKNFLLEKLDVEDFNDLRQYFAASVQTLRQINSSNATINSHNDIDVAAPLDSFIEFRLHKALLFYIPPIFFVIGVVGNILSFIILTRRSMRRVSTYRYLAVLSLTDTLVLMVGLLRLWLGELLGADPRDTAQWTCKLINVIGYTVSNYSVWLIVAVTVERYVAVCYPLLVPSICQPTRSMRVIMAVFSVQLLIHIHFLWTTELHSAFSPAKSMVTTHCEAAENYQTLINIIWPWVDTAIYSFLPFIIILIFNTMIIRKVFVSTRDRHSMCQTTSGHKMADSGTKLSIMLLTVSFTFLITTVPVNTILIVTSLWQNSTSSVTNVIHDRAIGTKFLLFRTITELLMYINHSTNFFLYCATGHKFRRQLYSLFSLRQSNNSGIQNAMGYALSSQHCVSIEYNKRLQNNELGMADV